MKKLVLLVAVLVLTIALVVSANAEYQTGTTVFFGQYEQDNNTDNGAEPIEWLVLDVEDGKALLLSVHALDCQPYNTQKCEMSWTNSSLRSWLLNTFYEIAFTVEEKAAILSTTHTNDDGNAEWSTIDGIETIPILPQNNSH